jgi:SAM-dependent methyltransferase
MARDHAYREGKTGPLDDLVFFLRTRQLQGQLGGAKAVADFGCGYDAVLLRRLLAQGTIERAIAVDLRLDPALAGPRLTLVPADLNQPLPLADASVDGATSLAVLEHLERPEVHLAELFRVLRPGGVLLLTTPPPRAKPVLELLAYRLHAIDEAEIRDHKRYFSASDLRSAFAAAGFDPGRVRHHPFLLGLNQLVAAHK